MKLNLGSVGSWFNCDGTETFPLPPVLRNIETSSLNVWGHRGYIYLSSRRRQVFTRKERWQLSTSVGKGRRTATSETIFIETTTVYVWTCLGLSSRGKSRLDQVEIFSPSTLVWGRTNVLRLHQVEHHFYGDFSLSEPKRRRRLL